MKHIIIIAILILSSIYAEARIGETQSQCDARYGAPKKSDGDGTSLYQKNGFYISIHFHADQADQLTIRKTSQNLFGTPEKISDNELQILLSANSDGKKWLQKTDLPFRRIWETSDGHLQACYDDNQCVLLILTFSAISRGTAAKSAEETKNLSGF